VKATDWLLTKQILGGGDWQIKNQDAEPGGWAFEYRNDFYPDVDDTAFVLMALPAREVSGRKAHGSGAAARHTVAAEPCRIATADGARLTATTTR